MTVVRLKFMGNSGILFKVAELERALSRLPFAVSRLARPKVSGTIAVSRLAIHDKKNRNVFRFK
jgi:hypothetical protein